MDYRKGVELVLARRREQLCLAAERFDFALRGNARLYAIELELRRLALDELHGLAIDKPRFSRLEAEKASILASLGLTDDVLNPPPSCSICGDSGLVRGQFCQCVKRLVIADSKNIALPLLRFSDSDKDIEKTTDLAILYDHMRVFVDKFPNTNTKNIVLLGSPGSGKTFLACCIAGEIVDRGFSVVFLTAFGLLQRMLEYHTCFDYAKKMDALQPILDCDLLIIDDLGTESILKNVTLEYLYIIINERALSNKHSLITSNLTVQKIGERYGEKLESRLFNKSHTLTKLLKSPDLRRS